MEIASHPESSVELSPLEGYAAWAPIYDDDGNPLVAMEGKVVAEMVGDTRGLCILDLGCGTGRHALALASPETTVHAVDQSEEMLAVAKSKANEELVQWHTMALPSDLPFENELFDVCVAGLVFEHIEDMDALLTEIRRTLKKSGRLIASGLHPDRLAAGQRARFIDPETGVRQPIRTLNRHFEEYDAMALSQGFRLKSRQILVPDEELARNVPRAIRYIGQALGWVSEYQVA